MIHWLGHKVATSLIFYFIRAVYSLSLTIPCAASQLFDPTRLALPQTLFC
ncbi:hypothetical protein QWZ13_08280 [Reinekea marina]|nr:hypothetical protein [Reinekea marina]MDN3648907.1 hypothetical protein [Reinekea marina]